MTYKRMLLIAVIFAAAAAFGVYKYLHTLEVQANIKELPYITVLAAKQDIPINKVIDTKDVEFKKVLQGDDHPNVFKEAKDLVGKVAITKISAGEQILSSKVAAKGDTTMGLGFIVSDGMRAITVAITEVSGVGYMIKPGDTVDLLVRVTKELPSKETIVGVSTLLQNIKVLAMANNLNREIINDKEGVAKTVTLEVYPMDAEKIFLATQDATLMLTLRSPGDKSHSKVPAVKYDDLSPELLKSGQSQNTAAISQKNTTSKSNAKK